MRTVLLYFKLKLIGNTALTQVSCFHACIEPGTYPISRHYVALKMAFVFLRLEHTCIFKHRPDLILSWKQALWTLIRSCLIFVHSVCNVDKNRGANRHVIQVSWSMLWKCLKSRNLEAGNIRILMSVGFDRKSPSRGSPFETRGSFVVHFCYWRYMVVVFMLPCMLLAALWSLAVKELIFWRSCVLNFLVFCHFPIWSPGSGMVLDCIDSWHLPSFFTMKWLLYIPLT